MYVSPYMVVNADCFTKHYHAGSQRIASKIGAGEFNNLYDASKACVTAGQKDYAERMNLITQSRNDYYAALGIPPGPPTAKGIYGEAEYSGKYGDYVIEPLGDYGVPTGWPMKPYKRPYGGTPGPPVMYEKPSDPEDEGAGYGYTNAENIQEKDIYFYHSDHLGSTSYITDKDGNATQFVCYKPYGEALVDEHNTLYEQPWKFNGKELDSETGLYYYGARYYEPVLAMWYSVDALAEKKSNISPYVYCLGNPIRLIDPDGNDEKQRASAVAKAQEYESSNKGNSYKLGAKGGPGEPVDCSGLVSQCVIAGGETDPNHGNSNGCSNIANNLQKIELENAAPGNVIIFTSEIDGAHPSHTGIITEVEVIDGKIQNLTMIDSGGEEGPKYSKVIEKGEKKHWGERIYGVYKWDTKPDAPEFEQIIPTTPTQTSKIQKTNDNSHFSLRDLWSDLCLKIQSLCTPHY